MCHRLVPSLFSSAGYFVFRDLPPTAATPGLHFHISSEHGVEQGKINFLFKLSKRSPDYP
jgi:hypothetical protein